MRLRDKATKGPISYCAPAVVKLTVDLSHRNTHTPARHTLERTTQPRERIECGLSIPAESGIWHALCPNPRAFLKPYSLERFQPVACAD